MVVFELSSAPKFTIVFAARFSRSEYLRLFDFSLADVELECKRV